MIFFHHEIQPFPPSLSQAEKLRTGTKSDLLQCLEEIAPASTQAPEIMCVILDGTAIVQMLMSGTARPLENMPMRYPSHLLSPSIYLQPDLTWCGTATFLKV